MNSATVSKSSQVSPRLFILLTQCKFILALLPHAGADSLLPKWYTPQILSNSELSLLPPSLLFPPLEISTEKQRVLAVNIIGAKSLVNSFWLQVPTSVWRTLENSIESVSVLEKNRLVIVWLDKKKSFESFSTSQNFLETGYIKREKK